MVEEIKKYLPLGSVVMMKEAKKPVMITGFGAKSPETGEKIWDYMGCLWPEGVFSSNKTLIFDHNKIDKVFAIGFIDDEQKDYMTKFEEEIKVFTSKVIKEKVESNQEKTNIFEEIN